MNPINTKPKQIDSSNSNPGIIPKENLKRKADVDIAVLAPIPEKKKIANEKARSNGNSASPKSNKSNFSEKPLSKIPLEEEKPKDAENKKEEKLVVKTTETIELETNFPVGKPIRKLERPKEAIIEKITEEKIDNLILEKSNEKVSEQANKPKRKSKSNEIIVQKITPNQNMSEMTQELHESKENDRQTSEGKEEQSKSKSKERAEMEIEETRTHIIFLKSLIFNVINQIERIQHQ